MDRSCIEAAPPPIKGVRNIPFDGSLLHVSRTTTPPPPQGDEWLGLYNLTTAGEDGVYTTVSKNVKTG